MALSGFIHDIFDNFHYLIGKYRDVPALLLLPCVVVFVAFTARAISRSARWLMALATVAALAIISIMAWTSISYLAAPGYLDHVEPSIATVSWWYSHGHPLYPAWEAGEGVYGFPYGPLLFQITAAALMLGPSILLSKLPGFLSFWIACGTVAWSLRPSLSSARQSLLPMTILMLVAGGYWRAAYWVRAEPYLLLCAALALFSYRRLSGLAAAIAIGLLSGCTINFKIHGVFYVLPYAAGLVGSSGSNAARLRTVVVGVSSGLFAAALPFLGPNVSLFHYIGFFQAALRHGLDPSLLLLNFRFGTVLVTPFLLLAYRHLRGEAQPDLFMGLVYCASVLIVCFIGGKRGAGPTHLLPFLPTFVFLMMRATQSMRIPGYQEARSATVALYFLALAIAYLPSFVSNLFSLQAWDRATDGPAVLREATQLYAEYPAAIMGAADDKSYAQTEYKAIGVFAGGPLRFDATTWMDLKRGGVTDDALQRLLINCRTPFWIIPNGGAPFTQTSAYDPDPLFSDEFRRLFNQQYEPVRNGEFYSVWSCRGGQPDH